ncbi:hypothetical protein Tco_1396425, partial [Tanacetum coccineum]
IVFDNTLTAIPAEPTICPPNENKLDFSISLDESDDEDYTVIVDENSFSYKIIFVNDLKTDLGFDEPLPPNPTVDYFDDLDYFKDFKNEFPAIVYNDGLTSKSDLGTKPLVISKCIDEFNLIDETSLSEYDEEIVSRFNDLFNDIHHDDLKSEKDDEDNDISIIQSSEDNESLHGENDMAPLPAADQRHPWLRYEVEGYTLGIVQSYEKRLETIWSRPVNRVHVLDFEGLTPEMRQDLAVRLRMFLNTCRMSDTEMGLDVADTLCFQLGGARMMMTWRQFILALGLHTEQEMAEDDDDVETKCLVIHFGLGPERQQAAAAGAPEADEAGSATEEVAPEILVPAPAQAPPLPPPAPQPCTMSQRIERLEEEVHDLRRDVVGLRGDVTSFTTEQSSVSTWLISCMTQLMDASGQTY